MLEISTHFLKGSTQKKNNENYGPLSLFLITSKIFQLIFCAGNSRFLFLLVEIFSLVLVAELSALKFILSYRFFFQFYFL